MNREKYNLNMCPLNIMWNVQGFYIPTYLPTYQVKSTVKLRHASVEI